MKNVLLLLILSSYSIFTSAQVTFTSDDLPKIGDTLYFAIDNDYSISDLSEKGAGLVWDFTDLYPNDLALNVYLDPVLTPFSDEFPTANIALRIDFEEPSYSYFLQNDSTVNILGLTANIEDFGGLQLLRFIDPQLFTVLPTSLGNSLMDTSSFEFEFQDPIFNQTFTLKSTTYSQINTDASGTVKTPGGDFDALLQQVITERRDSLFTFLFGENRLVEPLVELDTIYLWLSPESKGILLSTDANNSITYYAPDLANLQAPVADFNYNLLTNDDGTFYFFDSSANTPFRWDWDFGDGSTSTDQNPAHRFDTIGTFNVCLTVENSAGSNQSCSLISTAPSSTKALQNLIPLEVFPNPANEAVRFKTANDQLRDAQLNIFNQVGQIMHRQVFSLDQQITIKDWPVGLYYYQLYQSGQVRSSGQFSIIR